MLNGVIVSDIPTATCRYNNLHVIRLDLESEERHHENCPDQHVVSQNLNHVRPLIHGDLNFPEPSNLRNGSNVVDEAFEAKVILFFLATKFGSWQSLTPLSSDLAAAQNFSSNLLPIQISGN